MELSKPSLSPTHPGTKPCLAQNRLASSAAALILNCILSKLLLSGKAPAFIDGALLAHKDFLLSPHHLLPSNHYPRFYNPSLKALLS
jgi:hypothetical protein